MTAMQEGRRPVVSCPDDDGPGIAHDSRRAEPVVNLINLRVRHHAGFSGYDRLAEWLPGGRVINTPRELSRMQRVLARAGRRWVKQSGLKWYHRSNWVLETQLFRRWWFPRGQIFHFLYGENSFRYLGALRRLSDRQRLVATFHTPPKRFGEVVSRPTHLAALDAAVVMSTVQRTEIAKWMPECRIHFIPHGIDTDYYRPDPDRSITAGIRYLCVGRHLRDFEALETVASLIAARQSEATLTVVGGEAERIRFSRSKNVMVVSGIGDEQLRALYQDATALLMPLLDATANNALLEAMACGLPIVTTDLAGTRDYLDDSCAHLVSSGDDQGYADAAIRISSEPELRRRMGEASLARSQNFNWNRVAGQLVELYRSLW